MRLLEKKRAGKSRLPALLWKNRYYYLLLLPALLFFVLFCYVPMAGVVLAFKDFSYTKGIFGSDWAGLKHFERLFSSNSFYEILRNTIVISLYRLVFSFPMPVIFAPPITTHEMKWGR